MNDTIIAETTSHKHLGLTFSSTCTWAEHVHNIYLNAWSRLNSLLVQSQTWEAGLLMDADNVILLAQYQSNRARHVCKFAIDYLGQNRGQWPWSAKCA